MADHYDAPLGGAGAGFPGNHTSTPYQLPQLIEAARNCVDNFCLVRPEDKVLIVTEYDTDPLVAASFLTAVDMAGADVAVITTKPFAVGGHHPDEPSDIVMGAYNVANKVISMTYFAFSHSEKTFFARVKESGKSVCNVATAATPGAMATGGRFPMDLFVKIGESAKRILDSAKTVRYVTASGTDITFEGLQNITFNKALTPGSFTIFPPMGINFYPKTANGIFVPDSTSVHGQLLAPLKFTVSNGFVTDVEGAAEADAATVEAFANGKYYVRHTVIGLNPKARIHNAPQAERQRAAGTTYLGIDGTGAKGVPDLSRPGLSHLDVLFLTPTVYVDDKLFVDRRKLLLLEDEEIMEAARKYGEPRRILAQSPFVW
jgi:leucyl aminopeptidase (aminopeptidase T)